MAKLKIIRCHMQITGVFVRPQQSGNCGPGKSMNIRNLNILSRWQNTAIFNAQRKRVMSANRR
jgi:hypothetical protein